MIRVGQEAPDFELPGAAGGQIETHSLSEYTDRGWSVILVFYPFDFHPACTEQWCSFRDADWLTLMDDVVVLGIGSDGAYSHREYATKTNVQFPLLTDSDGRVSEGYGVLSDEFEGHRAVPERATFVIDPDRTVQFAWSASGPEDQPDFDAIQAATNCRGETCTIEETEDVGP